MIIHGDAVETMRGMADGSFAGVVTSPPFNIRNSTGNGLRNTAGGKWADPALAAGYDGHGDDMPHADYVAWQRDVLKECMRLTDDKGAIFYNHKWRVQNGLLQDRSDIVAGFPVRQIIIWWRQGGFNFNRGFYVPTYEVIYLIAKKAFKLAKGANGAGDVWEIPQDRNNPHPAPFPVTLAEKCVRAIGRGPILDPFVGSGTTAIACRRADLACTGIEKAERYVAMANDRIAEDGKHGRLF